MMYILTSLTMIFKYNPLPLALSLFASIVAMWVFVPLAAVFGGWCVDALVWSFVAGFILLAVNLPLASFRRYKDEIGAQE